LAHAIIVYALSFLSFEDLIQVSTATYCAAIILEFFALIDLRLSQPNLERPYKIGCGVKGLILMVVPAGLLSALNIIFCLAAGYLSFALTLIFFLLGPILWYVRLGLRDCMNKRKKEPFEDYTTDPNAAALLRAALATGLDDPMPQMERISLDASSSSSNSPSSSSDDPPLLTKTKEQRRQPFGSSSALDEKPPALSVLVEASGSELRTRKLNEKKGKDAKDDERAPLVDLEGHNE